MIAYVVEIEGPVLDAVLARRIARAHGWQRTGSHIQEHVDALASKAHGMSQEDVGTFYWPADKGPDRSIEFRRAADESALTMDEICMPELVTLAQEVVAGGKTGENVIVAMARELGLSGWGPASRGRFKKSTVGFSRRQNVNSNRQLSQIFS